jgi:hypothetical protein
MTSTNHDSIDPLDIGIAIAMGHNGFSDSEIISVLGYMPDLDITPEDLEASVEHEMIEAPSR